MSKIFLLLQKVHANVHDFNMKLNYSDPKIYTGGVDVKKWSSYSKQEQKDALTKDWYVYYSYRNTETGKLKRLPNIKAGVNRLKTKKERLATLKVLQSSLLILLRKGFSPFKNNNKLLEELEVDLSNSSKPNIEPITNIAITKKENENETSIKEAFKIALLNKKQVMGDDSFKKFSSRINRFEKWLEQNNYDLKSDVLQITKKDVIRYLNSVLHTSSPRNRNNSRTDLNSLFQNLEDNELIKNNFIKQVNILRAIPKRNKTYSPELQEQIFNYLETENPVLLLFIKFVSYNLLRPIEICRLRIEDIDLINKKLSVKAKNSPLKVKIIPEILFREIPNLSLYDKKSFLFTPSGIGMNWDASESNRRDNFTKQFKKVKDHFCLDKDYTIYSFRHTFITKMYKELRQNNTPFVVKSKLMLITGHSSMNALEQYLRKIDAELPEDYSNLLE